MEELKKVNTKKYEEVEKYAEALGMSTEEYLLSLHDKNQVVKAMLLQDGNGYKNFIQDFHDLLDGLTFYKEAMMKEVRNHKDEEMLELIVELLSKASNDPMLLAQFYEHYKCKDIDNEK